MFVSVTRLRIRSVRFLPSFFIAIFRTGRQVESASGFMGGELIIDRKLTFWTMTGWTDETAMIGYRNSGIHRLAMPRLLNWCDEATSVHWTMDATALPGWDEAYTKMKSDGFVTKVHHPSQAHLSRDFPAPRTTIRKVIRVTTSDA
jgi:hypothetical protein